MRNVKILSYSLASELDTVFPLGVLQFDFERSKGGGISATGRVLQCGIGCDIFHDLRQNRGDDKR